MFWKNREKVHHVSYEAQTEDCTITAENCPVVASRGSTLSGQRIAKAIAKDLNKDGHDVEPSDITIKKIWFE